MFGYKYYILLFSIFALGIILKHLNNKFSHTFDYKNYKKTDYLLTEAEFNFYKQLLDVIKDYNLVIFSKVRLADLVTIKSRRNSIVYWNKIRSKHIDFVLCDKSSKVILCIELDDKSHYTKKSKQSDDFKNSLLKEVKIPLLRFKCTNEYDFGEILQALKSNYPLVSQEASQTDIS